MQPVPGSSLAREEPSVADLKPYLKLRLGGSRSSAVLSKFLKDTIYNPPTRFDTSKSSREHTRSLDSQSVSSHSSGSSENPKKVRIVGRGGAGARLRNYSKGQNDKPAPAPIVEMAPHEAPVLRTVGRGGLGSRPKAVRGKSKAEPTNREPSFELLDMRKMSKQLKRSLSFDPEVRPESSRLSPVSTISTIHFAGETGLPSPDFFKVTKRRFEKRPLQEPPDAIDEAFDLEQTLSLQSSRSTSATPWDDTPTESRSSLDSRRKAKRRERRFSQLFCMFQNGVTRSTSSPASMSTLPSEITLTSIDTDPSYFFHGPGSPPSTPRAGRETDSTTESSYSARVGSSLSSFQREFSPGSSMPSSKQQETDDCHDDERNDEEVDECNDEQIDECNDEQINECNDDEVDECNDEEIDECNDEEIHEPSSPQPDQQKHSPTTRRNGIPFTLHLSPSEANALGYYPPLHGPFLHISDHENVPFVTSQHPPTMDSVTRSVRSESWTGEWNAGMVDVIRALRELR